MRCENRRRDGSTIVAPACFDGQAEVELTVVYGDLPFSGTEDATTLYVCRTCATRIREDAERHGYDHRTSAL